VSFVWEPRRTQKALVQITLNLNRRRSGSDLVSLGKTLKLKPLPTKKQKRKTEPQMLQLAVTRYPSSITIFLNMARVSGCLSVVMLILLAVVSVQEIQAACLPVNTDRAEWWIYVGKIGARKYMDCFETKYTSYQCCESETRTDFVGCELADTSAADIRCWGKKTVRACCTEDN
jgi:hypothetical protein